MTRFAFVLRVRLVKPVSWIPVLMNHRTSSVLKCQHEAELSTNTQVSVLLAFSFSMNEVNQCLGRFKEKMHIKYLSLETVFNIHTYPDELFISRQ